MHKVITEEILGRYREHLYEEEMAEETIKKYMRDLGKLMEYAAGRELTKKLIVAYKSYLLTVQEFMPSSINTFLVAANKFFSYMGWHGLRVKTYRIQKDTFRQEGEEMTGKDYRKLFNAAVKKGKIRLAMIIKTVYGTGIRISELENITVESVAEGVIRIFNKRKHREIPLSKKLQAVLLKYIKETGIVSGIVFRTSGGKAVDRSNIWREMKALSEEAGVRKSKVFPHNLRHLFAKTFYGIDKDIARLAAILGHSSIETTRIYIMATCRECREQLDMMDLE